MAYSQPRVVNFCPFCGKDPAVQCNKEKDLYFISCCFIRKFGYFRTKESLFRAWNSRFFDDDIPLLTDKNK